MLQIQFKFGRCEASARNDHDDDMFDRHDDHDDHDMFDPATFSDSITRYHTFS